MTVGFRWLPHSFAESILSKSMDNRMTHPICGRVCAYGMANTVSAIANDHGSIDIGYLVLTVIILVIIMMSHHHYCMM